MVSIICYHLLSFAIISSFALKQYTVSPLYVCVSAVCPQLLTIAVINQVITANAESMLTIARMIRGANARGYAQAGGYIT